MSRNPKSQSKSVIPCPSCCHHTGAESFSGTESLAQIVGAHRRAPDPLPHPRSHEPWSVIPDTARPNSDTFAIPDHPRGDPESLWRVSTCRGASPEAPVILPKSRSPSRVPPYFSRGVGGFDFSVSSSVVLNNVKDLGQEHERINAAAAGYECADAHTCHPFDSIPLREPILSYWLTFRVYHKTVAWWQKPDTLVRCPPMSESGLMEQNDSRSTTRQSLFWTLHAALIDCR
jgi:hypothetical protein